MILLQIPCLLQRQPSIWELQQEACHCSVWFDLITFCYWAATTSPT